MATFEKRTIYYFTGTGNSLRAAQVVAKTLGNTEIISMRCNPVDVPAVDSDVIGYLNLTFPEVEQRLGKVKEIQFNCWGEYRIYFMKSKEYRFEFGNIPLPSEYWYTWETEEFYADYQWRQADNMVFFEGGDDCDSIEVKICSAYPEWKDQPTVFHSSMVEATPDFDPSDTEVFYSMVEEREKRRISTFEGMYDAEYIYNGYRFYFSWLNSDGSFTEKTWCMVRHT